MNVLFFMQPKAQVAYLYDDFTIRQTLEKMHHHGYAAIPVLDRDGRYFGTISEGDLLWYIVRGEGGTVESVNISNLEDCKLSDVKMRASRYLTVRISAQIDELLQVAINQNFIPVLDDDDKFIGIVTRSAVLKYFYDNVCNDDSGFEDSK